MEKENKEIKKGDFIEIEYTGKIRNEERIIDTTDEALAKKANIYSENTEYGPITICIGEKHLLEGLDKNIEGKKIGEEIDVNLKPEEAFGKKNPKLLQIVPLNKFRQSNMQPVPGMQINIDGILATIKTISGGRVIVDFNHPLSGRELNYKIKLNKIIENIDDKIRALINILLKIPSEKTDVKVENNKAEITIKGKAPLPKEIAEKMSEKIRKLLPEIEKVDFKAEKQAEIAKTESVEEKEKEKNI